MILLTFEIIQAKVYSGNEKNESLALHSKPTMQAFPFTCGGCSCGTDSLGGFHQETAFADSSRSKPIGGALRKWRKYR